MTTSQGALNVRLPTSGLSSSSSVPSSNRSASPTSIKSETIFVTPVGRAPVSRRVILILSSKLDKSKVSFNKHVASSLQQKDGLHTAPTSATPSRLRTPRVVVRSAAVTPALSSSCSRLTKMTPRALPLPESPRPISVVEFSRRGGNYATNGTAF